MGANMKKITFILLILISFGIPFSAIAKPEEKILNELNSEVLRVEVNHQNGSKGLGSGVVIASSQVATNCHVVTNAKDIKVVFNNIRYIAESMKPDWHHDICILNIPKLDAPIAKFGSSKHLRYQDSVLTVGYPSETEHPVNSFGEIVGLFPMDGGMVISATSGFNLGASGGGIFDDSGRLLGLITLKSRGDSPKYFFMPVEWVLATLDKPDQDLGIPDHKPFWAKNSSQLPFFMRVVQPLAKHDWKTLKNIASDWVKDEPNAAESWRYLAIAEYEVQDYQQAIAHFEKAKLVAQDDIVPINYRLNVEKIYSRAKKI